MESVRGSSMEMTVPLPAMESTETSPRISWILLFTTSMPTPRPETSETFSDVEKPLAKMRLRVSLSVSLALASMSPFSIGLLADFGGVHAFAIVGNLDDDGGARVEGFEEDDASGVLACRYAFLGGLDAVVAAVADDVEEGVFEVVDDILIELDLTALDDELHLFSELDAEVSHEALELYELALERDE